MSHHPILHVIVCGFNHKKGCKVDFCYPVFPNSKSQDADDNLPKLWSHLPSLAIPDGAHNFAEDIIYFVLPSLDEKNRAVFGVACYRQIDTASLVSKEDDVTRNHVQKSVCVLSKIPMYGVLTAKLELITQAYFNEKDFSKVQVLKQMYTSLCDIFDYITLDQQSLYIGISLSPLLKTFAHRTLELFKLILLEKRVIFEVQGTTSLLGKLIIGLISLLPCMLEDGLFEAAAYKTLDAQHQEELPTADSQSRGPSQPRLETNDYGFPLNLFTKGNLLLPYLSLNSLDSLRSNSTRAYCIGVTNFIFRTNSDLHDVYVTVDKNGIGDIHYSDATLEKQLSLTMQDMRFMQTLLKSTEVAKQNSADFNGNDDWVRLQFYSYLCSMFRVAQLKSEHLVEYNDEFVKAWTVTHNFRSWNQGNYEKLNEFQSIHPASGPVNAKDLFLLLGNRLGQKRRLLSTISSTTKYMSEQGNKLQSTFSSWLGRGQSDTKS